MAPWSATPSWARRTFAGSPVIVIRDGKVLHEHLRRERLTEDDLKSAAREKGYADLDEIAIAVLEDDGAVSFIAR